MKRRKFIIGTGALAAGGAAAIGTGAYSAAEMDRDANIDVVNDAQGLLALRVGEAGDGVAREDDGELTIDFTAGGNAGGVNVNSRYQVGVFNEHGSWPIPTSQVLESSLAGITPGFYVLNQDTAEHDLTVEYEVSDPSAILGSEMYFQWVPQGGQSNAAKHWFEIDENNPSDSFTDDLPSGHQYSAALLVDTRGAAGEDPGDLDLSGTLTVSAD